VVLLALLACSSSVSASEYTVEVCTPSSSTGGGTVVRNPDGTLSGSGLSYEGDQDVNHFLLLPCNSDGNIVLHNQNGAFLPEGSFRSARLIAPDGTRIKEMTFSAPFTRPLDLTHPSFLRWAVLAGDLNLTPGLEYYEDGRPFFVSLDGDGGGTFKEIEDRTASVGMFCVVSTCGPGELIAVIRNFTAQIEDDFLPGVSDPQVVSRTLRGTVDVGFKAVDRGSGVAKVELLLDGNPVDSRSEDNGGRCGTPYKYMQPCALEFESSFGLDTTALPEGRHELAILATDAAGLTRESQSLAVLVHNAPLSLARPSIHGPARVGAKLSATPGEWIGDPTAFAFRWFRCPATVNGDEGLESCRAIPGANKQRYVASRKDLGRRDLVEVTATNAFGSESSLSFPSDVIDQAGSVDGNKPVLTHVRLSRKRFRVGPTLEKKGKRGAVLAFTCDRGGQLSIAIRRVRRHGKPKPLGKLVAEVKAGRSRVLISGEIGKRRLRPGPYEASVRVTDKKGAASDPARVRFRIIPG
jgi:hypothetical protein